MSHWSKGAWCRARWVNIIWVNLLNLIQGRRWTLFTFWFSAVLFLLAFLICFTYYFIYSDHFVIRGYLFLIFIRYNSVWHLALWAASNYTYSTHSYLSLSQLNSNLIYLGYITLKVKLSVSNLLQFCIEIFNAGTDTKAWTTFWLTTFIIIFAKCHLFYNTCFEFSSVFLYRYVAACR